MDKKAQTTNSQELRQSICLASAESMSETHFVSTDVQKKRMELSSVSLKQCIFQSYSGSPFICCHLFVCFPSQIICSHL